MDLMCNPEEQYERGINLSPMGTLNSPLIIPRAIRDGTLGTEIINGAYRLNDSQERLPELDWLHLLDLLRWHPVIPPAASDPDSGPD